MTDLPDICKGCRLNYERMHTNTKTKQTGMIKGCTYIDEIRRLEQVANGKMVVRCSFRKGD